MKEKKVILVIDDDTDILESLQTVLSSAGFDVATVTSGREGVEAIEKCKPDLIFCDMMMESIDAGMQTARDIKQQYPAIPIYLLSSIAEATASTTELRELGFNGIVQKPVDPGTVLSLTKNVLKQ